MKILLAIFIGTYFGFVLQKIGASNSDKIINMLRLKDFHLMKTIFLGIGLSSLVLFTILALGGSEYIHFSIKSAYIGVIIGGALLGFGWAISGFCPGTAVVSAGEGNRESFFFILGGILGTFIYMLSYSSIKSSFLFQKIAGGKVTLAQTSLSKYLSLLPNIPPLIVAGGIAFIFIVIAFLLPSKIKISE